MKKNLTRLQYLNQNVDYLSIRERQEYYELLNEYNALQGYSTIDSDEYRDHWENYSNEYEPDASPQDSRNYKEPNRTNRSSLKSRPKSKLKPNKNHRSGGDPELGNHQPKNKKKRKKHWFRWILTCLIVIIVVMIGFFIYGYSRGVQHEGGTIKNESFTGQTNSDGSTNILVLGADKRPGQSEDVAHTDSIMVLHISKDHKTVRLVSFMRDTLVTVPGVSSYSGKPNVKINAAFTIGEQYSKQGINLLSETLKENFGVNIQYYAVLDFSSFATVIDSLFPSGVEIDAKFSTINGVKMTEVPVPDDLALTEGKVSSDKVLSASQAAALGYPDGGGIFMMIKQGTQKMDGRTLLNYARFRHDDQGDAGRVARQQQVMSTVITKLKNPLVLFTGSSALGTARAVTMTNIPNSFFLTNGLGTLFGMQGGLNSTTIPAVNDWTNAYDKYGGLGLSIDMNKYKTLAQE